MFRFFRVLKARKEKRRKAQKENLQVHKAIQKQDREIIHQAANKKANTERSHKQRRISHKKATINDEKISNETIQHCLTVLERLKTNSLPRSNFKDVINIASEFQRIMQLPYDQRYVTKLSSYALGLDNNMLTAVYKYLTSKENFKNIAKIYHIHDAWKLTGAAFQIRTALHINGKRPFNITLPHFFKRIAYYERKVIEGYYEYNHSHASVKDICTRFKISASVFHQLKHNQKFIKEYHDYCNNFISLNFNSGDTDKDE